MAIAATIGYWAGILRAAQRLTKAAREGKISFRVNEPH